MKTKELIELLNWLDPDGNIDVCYGNMPIVDAEVTEAYYDGKLERFTYNSNQEPISATRVTTGLKLSLTTLSIRDKLWDRPDFHVDYSGDYQEQYREGDDKVRKASKDLDVKLNTEHFIEWVQKIAGDFTNPLGTEIVRVAKQFVDYNYKNLFPAIVSQKKPNGSYESYIEAHFRYWNEKLTVELSESGLSIRIKFNEDN